MDLKWLAEKYDFINYMARQFQMFGPERNNLGSGMLLHFLCESHKSRLISFSHEYEVVIYKLSIAERLETRGNGSATEFKFFF